MEDQPPCIKLLDRNILEFALQVRELSQRRDELHLQIKVCRAGIAERKSFIETTHNIMKRLEQDITMKQNTVRRIKDNARSMKVTNSLLQHFEMTLKEELERKQDNYNHDNTLYEERIASYRNVLQQHREFYCKNPIAKQALAIQPEREVLEGESQARDDQTALRRESVVGASVDSALTENQAESVSAQLTDARPAPQRGPPTEAELSFSRGMASLHLRLTEDVGDVHFSGEDPIDKRAITDALAYPPLRWSNLESPAQKLPSEKKATGEAQDPLCGPETQEEPAGSPAREEDAAAEEEMDEGTAGALEEKEEGEEQPLPVAEEDHHDDHGQEQRDSAALRCFSPPRIHPPSPPGGVKPAPPSTSTFNVRSSPPASPGRGPAHRTTPTFLFAPASDPSTPHFTSDPSTPHFTSDPSTSHFAGFGFDMGSAQEEDSPFSFTSSYFSEKKSRCASPSGPGFLFDRSDRPEGDFLFSFSSAKSPAGSGSGQDEAADAAFPFSFSYS